MKKWLLRIVNTLAILLIVLSVLVLLTVTLTPADQVPRVLGYSVMRVMTGSMEPSIPQNAMILVQKTDPDRILPGDVITFFSQDPALNGALNTHRVARIEQQGDNHLFITRGDANQIEDPIPVTQDLLVGRVVFVSAALGVLVSLLTNPLVFGLLILLPLLILLIANLVRTVRLSARLAREEEEKAIREALEEARKKREPNEKTES